MEQTPGSPGPAARRSPIVDLDPHAVVEGASPDRPRRQLPDAKVVPPLAGGHLNTNDRDGIDDQDVVFTQRDTPEVCLRPGGLRWDPRAVHQHRTTGWPAVFAQAMRPVVQSGHFTIRNHASTVTAVKG